MKDEFAAVLRLDSGAQLVFRVLDDRFGRVLTITLKSGSSTAAAQLLPEEVDKVADRLRHIRDVPRGQHGV